MVDDIMPKEGDSVQGEKWSRISDTMVLPPRRMPPEWSDPLGKGLGLLGFCKGCLLLHGDSTTWTWKYLDQKLKTTRVRACLSKLATGWYVMPQYAGWNYRNRWGL